MKIVLTNDDGIDAPGIEALERACRALGELVVVAPAAPQSGVGHSMTIFRGIRVEERGRARWALHASPADCARIALHRFAPDADLLVSGINQGGNLGADVYPSGTVAAAREATLHGCRAIAVSQMIGVQRVVDWELTARRARRVLEGLLDAGPGEGAPPARATGSGEGQEHARAFWNVNLPHPPHEDEELEVVHCPVDPHPLQVDYRECDEGRLWYAGDYHGRRREPDHDVEVCFGGRVSVSRISLQGGG